MAIITEDMERMVAGLRLCYVATVTPDGKPNLSPKGSLRVIDKDHLAFADIMSPATVRNLKQNPYIEVNMVDPFLRRGYRFKGVCEIVTEGATFDLVANELWDREGRQYPVNAVVKIAVQVALPVRSPAYVFNKGVKEDDVRSIWLERYGVQPLAPIREPKQDRSGGAS
jgi:predicted pyridoxine 5'-phosphate oxidase superfamily flavin-nucleotide-binding protein